MTIGEKASPNRSQDETDKLGVCDCNLVIVGIIVELIDYGAREKGKKQSEDQKKRPDCHQNGCLQRSSVGATQVKRCYHLEAYPVDASARTTGGENQSTQ